MSNVPGQSFQPGTAVAPCSKVEVSVSCRNLRDKDVFSKSDPMCVLYVRDVKSNTYYEFGRTEMIKDTLKPDFVKKFIMDYYFEESQKLKFEIYDVDSSSGALSSHDFLGRMECTLGEIVGCGSGRIERKLVGIQGNAFIYVRAEEISSSKEHVFLHLRATGLDKKDFFGKSDPFLLFYRANGDGSYTVVHKTEVIKNTLNPTWKPFSITARSLCNGDHNRTIKIECYDWDSDGGHDFIGEFTTTLADLVKAPTSNTTYDVINPKKRAKKRNYKHSGELMVMECRVEIVPSFLDYLQGGVDMNFTVAIDFTASNGNPSSPTSLHYYDPYRPNQYASAIQAVGEIIQDYDTDKMFPVLGFGARLPNGSVSHEFPCNFDANNPYCAGIQGIMQAYYTSMRQVQLYGPTNFSPVINHVAKFAASKTDGSNYFVLLIITDGVITDMPQTINAIVQASHLPMSIIIVGVGDAEFDAMDILDADGKRLGIDGRYAERDIVQFVPFREFMRGQYSNNPTLSQAALAKAVLAEIPEQVTYYMKKRGFKPKPQRKTAPPSSVPAAGQMGGQQGPGVQPYQPGQPGGAPNTAPYPQGGPGAPPYPQSGASGSAPYPQGGAPGSAPYPQAGAPGSAPYPQGGAPGSAPYPQGGAPGSAPPGGPGASPYPQGGPGAPPYPQGGPGSAPYPQSGAPGSAPYPQAGGPGTAPYPQAGVQGSNPQPTAPPGAPQRPPPSYQNSRQTNI
ncbi:Copine-9 [Mactra antiquata]